MKAAEIHKDQRITYLKFWMSTTHQHQRTTNTIQSFSDEFLELYIVLGTTCTNLIIMSDFNTHVDDLYNSDARQFNDVCMAIGLEVVNFGGHVQGHRLDLGLHESNSSIKIRKIQPGMYVLDHCFVKILINIETSHVVFKKSPYRNRKKADMKKVCAQLADLDIKLNYDTEYLSEFLEDYQEV